MKYKINSKSTLKDLISELDILGNGFLAIVNEDEKLIGIITDGDVRRAILNDVTDIDQIINKNPKKVSEGTPKQRIISLLKDLHRKHMPVVDNEGKLVEVVYLDDIEFNHKPNKVVIMAGGLGARLGELTKITPKPMLYVGDKPILDHIIESFKDYGYTNFIISVNYKSEQIKDYFLDGSHLGVNIEYIEEKTRLGTGGALSLLDTIPAESFFVINGDVITSLNFEKLMAYHEENQSVATMCTHQHEVQIPYGVIKTDGESNILKLEEKPIVRFHVNSGIYVLCPSVLNYLPKNEYFDLPSLFSLLLSNKQMVKSFELTDFWVDVGNPSDYQNINSKLTLV